MKNKTFDERLKENHTPSRIRTSVNISIGAGIGYAISGHHDIYEIIGFITSFYFGASLGVPIVNHTFSVLYRTIKEIGGLARELGYIAMGKKIGNEPQTLEEALEPIELAEEVGKKWAEWAEESEPTHIKKSEFPPVYICQIVDKEQHEGLSRAAGLYGVVGHSYDKEHIYLRAENPEKAREIVKDSVSKEARSEGIIGVYTATKAPAPGLDENEKRFELRDDIKIQKEWPISITFYDAVVDADVLKDKIKALKEFAAVNYDNSGAHHSKRAKLRPHSREHWLKLLEYRRDEVNSGIHKMSYNIFVPRNRGLKCQKD